MDSQKLRERKRVDIKSKKNVDGLQEQDLDESGVDWKCAALILILVFISVFMLSLSLGGQGVLNIEFPKAMNSIIDSIANWKRSGQLSDHQLQDLASKYDETGKSFSENDSDFSQKESRVHAPKEKTKSKIKPKPKLDKPTILWWTDALYPHAHRGPISEITCGKHTCLSTNDKRILSDPLTRGILFYGTDFRAYEAPLPRMPWHEWALLHEESPMNNYALVHSMKLFNHSATFSRQSGYPTTTHLLPNLDYLTERKPVPIEEKNRLRKEGNLAPIVYVQSHCDVASDRDRFVKELMKHIKVDSYGKCLNNKKLPEYLDNPVESMLSEGFYDFLAKYKFHLSFENAICEDYITEKFFRPLHVGSVPIYKGSPSARDWAPSIKSFVNVDQFESPQQLAYFIKLLDEHDDVYLNHLTFKSDGITNHNLIDHMKNRGYAENEANTHSFISGFECHVCEKIAERYNAEQGGTEPDHPILERTIGHTGQLGCPPPTPSVGTIEDIPELEGIHTWIQDYWGMRDQAAALNQMIKNGEKDSSKLFDVIQQIYNEM